MNTSQPIYFLYSLQHFGIKLGLKNISSLLEFFGNPHKKFSSIHIAGTNGKGSTSALLASSLISSGYKTGLYTSPHILSVNERISINGFSIPEHRLNDLVNVSKKEILKLRATFFETLTAIAFQYFSEEKIDIAVVETGLGGRFDATNVIVPILSIITNISLEHTEVLGQSIEQIAFEKAGIIKKDIPCISSVEQKSAKKVIKEIAKRNNSPLFFSSDFVTTKLKNVGISSNVYQVEMKNKMFESLNVHLGGYFQEKNISTSLLSVQTINNFSKKLLPRFYISKKNIYEGWKNIHSITHFQGRLDVLCRQPLVVCDVAHNPDAISNLVDSVKFLFPKRGVIVFGLMRDKNLINVLYQLRRLNVKVIAVQPKTERASPSIEIVRECHRIGIQSINGKSVANGITIAKKEIGLNDYMLICGSFFVVSEAMYFFNKNI